MNKLLSDAEEDFFQESEVLCRSMWGHFVGLMEGLHQLHSMIHARNFVIQTEGNTCGNVDAVVPSIADSQPFKGAIDALRKLGTNVKSINQKGNIVNIVLGTDEASNDDVQFPYVDSHTESVEDQHANPIRYNEFDECRESFLPNISSNYPDTRPSSSTGIPDYSSFQYQPLQVDAEDRQVQGVYDSRCISSSTNLSEQSSVACFPAERTEYWGESNMYEDSSHMHEIWMSPPNGDCDYFVKEEHEVRVSPSNINECEKPQRSAEQRSFTNPESQTKRLKSYRETSRPDERPTARCSPNICSFQALDLCKKNVQTVRNVNALSSEQVASNQSVFEEMPLTVEHSIRTRMPSMRKRKSRTCSCCGEDLSQF